MKGPAVLGVPRQKPEVGVFTIKALPHKDENVNVDHRDPSQNKAVTEDE